MSVPKNTNAEPSRRGSLLIDAQEVARRLSLSQRTVFRLAAAGTLPKPIGIGGKSKLWRVVDVKEWDAAGRPDHSILEQRATTRAAEMGEAFSSPAVPKFGGWYAKEA
jgi:predicted DNA-binding transcriptional regulator AlpA